MITGGLGICGIWGWNGETVINIADNACQRGRIELQVFGGATVVEFRKIEIHEISRPPAAAAAAIPDPGKSNPM